MVSVTYYRRNFVTFSFPDVHREAAKRTITVESVEAEVDGDFGAEGEPTRNVKYRVKIAAQGDEREIRELTIHTDTVAEIQNTLRAGVPVALTDIDIVTWA